jgi:hypothetical protein
VNGFWQKHGTTAATLLMVAFALFLAVAIALDTDDTSAWGRTTGGVVFGLCTLALMAGLWLLRDGRATSVAYTLIVVGALVPGVAFFWMLLLPTILAFIIIFFGVVRGGLVRELRPSQSPPAV